MPNHEIDRSRGQNYNGEFSMEGNTPLNRLPKEHWANPWEVIHSYDPNYVQNFAPFNADARAFLASL